MSDLLENPMLCANCGEPGCFAKCPCKQVQYCSKECQVADWSLHKERCRARLDKKVRKAKAKHGKEHAAVGQAWMEAGDAFFSEGRFAEAERYYLKARHIFTAAHGEDHFKVGIVCLKLSRVYGGMCMEKERGEEQAKGNNILSRKFQQRLTNGIDELGSEFDGFDVFVSNHIGSDLLEKVPLDDEHFQHMKLIVKLDKRRALPVVLGEDVRYTIHSVMGFQYKTRGKLEKALKMFQKALRIIRLADKADDERVADELGNISGIFLEQDRLVEARANYEEALGILRRLHGEKHPKVASAFEGIADILRRQGKYDEALEVYKKVLNIQRRVYGKNHIEVVWTFGNIGTIMFVLGKFEEAAQVYEEAIRKFRICDVNSSSRERALALLHFGIFRAKNNMLDFAGATANLREYVRINKQLGIIDATDENALSFLETLQESDINHLTLNVKSGPTLEGLLEILEIRCMVEDVVEELVENAVKELACGGVADEAHAEGEKEGRTGGGE